MATYTKLQKLNKDPTSINVRTSSIKSSFPACEEGYPLKIELYKSSWFMKNDVIMVNETFSAITLLTTFSFNVFAFL